MTTVITPPEFQELEKSFEPPKLEIGLLEVSGRIFQNTEKQNLVMLLFNASVDGWKPILESTPVSGVFDNFPYTELAREGLIIYFDGHVWPTKKLFEDGDVLRFLTPIVKEE